MPNSEGLILFSDRSQSWSLAGSDSCTNIRLDAGYRGGPRYEEEFVSQREEEEED